MLAVATSREEGVSMSSNLITKEVLARGLKDLLLVMPLSKISVKSITTCCNISRNTFYYHFRDKYELINWIFYTDMLKNVNSFNDPDKLVDSFVSVCQCLYADRKFYMTCLQYYGQNCLTGYLYDFYFELWKININISSAESGVKLTESELNMLARMRTHSLIGIISDWAHDGMKENYMAYFEQLRKILEMERQEYFTSPQQDEIQETCDAVNSVEKEETEAC